MAKYTASYSEQSAKHSRPNKRVCPTCKTKLSVDDQDYTNRVLHRADHPLVGYITMLTWDGGSDNPSTRNDVFLAWIDKEKRPRAQRREDTIQVVRDFATKYPVLASAVVESIVAGRSDHAIADELGLTHPTIGKMLARGQSILHQLATEASLYEMAC